MQSEKSSGFLKGFISGLGWSFGVTVGFAIVSTLIVFVFQYLGGIPVIGTFFANIVEETQNQLVRRSIVVPN